jgi:hypothetical protein
VNTVCVTTRGRVSRTPADSIWKTHHDSTPFRGWIRKEMLGSIIEAAEKTA